MINHLKLKNFRLFDNIDLKFNKKNVIFVGKNAVGKTSIIEAIYYIGVTKTYRYDSVIKFDKEFSIIELDNGNKFKIIINKKGKKVFYNNEEIKKLSDYIGLFKVVINSSDDFNIIKGSPINRRKFIDVELTKISKKYLDVLKEYKKLLKERNQALKGDNYHYIKILDKEILKLIKKIIDYRTYFFNDLEKYSNEIYNLIVENNKLSIIYDKNINNESEFYNKLDFINKITNKGPHKDDFRIELNNVDSKNLSQGEQKSILIALKLGLYKIIKERLKESPIILLDDLLSDLDIDRQNKVINIIKNENIFITTNNLLNISKDLLNESQIFLIEDKIKEC